MSENTETNVGLEQRKILAFGGDEKEMFEDRFSMQKILGINAPDNIALIGRIEKGLPFNAFVRLGKNTGISLDNLRIAVGIKQRTLTRRKQSNKLSSEESDRLVSVYRLLAQTLELFEGNKESARDWFTNPNRALGGRSPLEVSATETGTREVENLIGRLEHGVFT